MTLTDPQIAALRLMAEGSSITNVGTGKRLLGTLCAAGLAGLAADRIDGRITDAGRAALELYKPIRGFVQFEQAGSHRRGVAHNDQGGAKIQISWHSSDTHNRAGAILTRRGTRHVQWIPRERVVLDGGATIGDRIAQILEEAR